MGTDIIFPLAQIAVLVLGGATALYYAYHNPLTRFRNTLISLFLLTLAGFHIFGA